MTTPINTTKTMAGKYLTKKEKAAVKIVQGLIEEYESSWSEHRLADCYRSFFIPVYDLADELAKKIIGAKPYDAENTLKAGGLSEAAAAAVVAMHTTTLGRVSGSYPDIHEDIRVELTG